MAMNRATPKYQATGVSSGQEAPKIAPLSPTVVCSSHPPRSANGLHTGVRVYVRFGTSNFSLPLSNRMTWELLEK